MSAVATLTIFPLGKKENLGPFVARALKIVEASGLAFELGPMGTALEGEFDEVMAVASRCMQELSADNDRVYMTLAVDNRTGPGGRIAGKVDSVKRALTKEGA